MKNLNKLFLVCLLAMATGFSSCGYHFESGGYINDDVASVAVKVMENKSSETGAQMQFTNALIREIQQKTDTKVVKTVEGTPFFEGTILSITFGSLARETTETVIDRRVTATVDLRLINEDGSVAWSVKNFTWHEDYTVGVVNIGDAVNKSVAVEKIAERIAEKLISQLQSNF